MSTQRMQSEQGTGQPFSLHKGVDEGEGVGHGCHDRVVVSVGDALLLPARCDRIEEYRCRSH